MFQNSYQNGTYFDVFDPKAPQDKVKTLYKMAGVQGNNKLFDKDLKTYVFEFISAHSKITFPKQDRKDLYLIQPYITFQIYLYPGTLWNIELTVSDLQKTKRRIILSSATTKIEKKPFFVKYPCAVKQGLWINFTVDLFSFINAFKGQTYRSLDSIQVSGQYKLRRIFTSQSPPSDAPQHEQQPKPITFLPKNYYFPPGYEIASHLINYEDEHVLEHGYEPTEASTKNDSHIKKKTQNNSIKSEKNVGGYKGEKKFLANTNGPDTVPRKMKKEMEADSQFSESSIKVISKTPATTEKHISKRKALGKTHTTKAKSSLEKKKTDLQSEKNKMNAKVNPWRSNNKRDIQTDGGKITQTKIENERKVESAQTTLFKTKNNLATKKNGLNESKNAGFDRKSDHHSDSEYFQLSQKFTTVTDGKFFKNQLGSQFVRELNQDDEDNDEIEENIEMESNSVHSQKKNDKKQFINQLNEKPIDESICDSLEGFQNQQIKTAEKEKKHSMLMSSYYGFGEKIMNKFMGQVERPYSPPLGERQQTQQNSQRNQESDKQIELMYDPVLNCYYDHKTHTYYQLK